MQWPAATEGFSRENIKLFVLLLHTFLPTYNSKIVYYYLLSECYLHLRFFKS